MLQCTDVAASVARPQCSSSAANVRRQLQQLSKGPLTPDPAPHGTAACRTAPDLVWKRSGDAWRHVRCCAASHPVWQNLKRCSHRSKAVVTSLISPELRLTELYIGPLPCRSVKLRSFWVHLSTWELLFWALAAAYDRLAALPPDWHDNLTDGGRANLASSHHCWWRRCSLISASSVWRVQCEHAGAPVG